jgi:hypothetical protein
VTTPDIRTGTDTLNALIARVTFKQTTYIEAHEYVVKTWSADCATLFDAITGRIATEGYERRFYGKNYRYINLGAYRYWTIEDVLNRALLPTENHVRQG